MVDQAQAQEAVVPGVSFPVERGDAAPPIGEPFDPAVNLDVEIGPSLKAFKRGDKLAYSYTGDGPLLAYLERFKVASEAAGPVVEEVSAMAEAQAEVLEKVAEAERAAAEAAAKGEPAPGVEPANTAQPA